MNVGSDSGESPESTSGAIIGQNRTGSPAKTLIIGPTTAAAGSVSDKGQENGPMAIKEQTGALEQFQRGDSSQEPTNKPWPRQSA